MGGPKDEEANYSYEGYQGEGYRGNNYGRSFKNWQDRQPRDKNRNSQPQEDVSSAPPTPKKKFDESEFEKTIREFMMKERYVKFINLIKEDKINVPLVDVLAGMPNYGKFLKDLVSNKSTMEQISTAFLNKECSSIVQNKLPPKLGKSKDQEFYPRNTNRSGDETSSRASQICFSRKDSLLLVIISALLQDDEKKRLVSVLKKHKEVFAWKTSDIPGISPSFCKHKINFEDDAKPVIQRQHRLNPSMKEVVKKEIIKLIVAGIIYAIKDSPWASYVHCVPKKQGMTVVTNEKNELIPTRTITGWRVCIDYCKLNEATQKDHFPLPFMDQMLERLSRNKFFCFLNGFSGYIQIPIGYADQEKTTFTYPYGTYAYKRMPFGLCNTPTTFQRRMIVIFQDMLETSIEELRDDDIDDNFPEETLMNISSTEEDKIPWAETRKILNECHHGPTGGCYAPSNAAKKVFYCWAVGQQSSKRLIL
ncbi:hypothetical protein Tco_0682230 [Tanacetum coccineum]|uniref:Reverse transcriptase domain-containing protein n=1 Tax=Tanacetum coccineum TaxID=301880 RepID=A0ABQ4XQL6_9ASTR